MILVLRVPIALCTGGACAYRIASPSNYKAAVFSVTLVAGSVRMATTMQRSTSILGLRP